MSFLTDDERKALKPFTPRELATKLVAAFRRNGVSFFPDTVHVNQFGRVKVETDKVDAKGRRIWVCIDNQPRRPHENYRSVTYTMCVTDNNVPSGFAEYMFFYTNPDSILTEGLREAQADGAMFLGFADQPRKPNSRTKVKYD